MAEEKKDEAAGQNGEAGEAKPAGPSKLPLILGLVNTLAILGAGGMFYYTRVLYKRPAITEAQERARIEAAEALAKANKVLTPGVLPFGPLNVNIRTGMVPGPNGTQIPAKIHSVQMKFSLELRDMADAPTIKAVEPKMMDQLLAMMGRKSFEELTTVQGRYVLRTQIQDMVNQLVNAEAKTKDLYVTGVFFSDFLVN
jgi:flagellar basal body-associated protein FliL